MEFKRIFVNGIEVKYDNIRLLDSHNNIIFEFDEILSNEQNISLSVYRANYPHTLVTEAPLTKIENNKLKWNGEISGDNNCGPLSQGRYILVFALPINPFEILVLQKALLLNDSYNIPFNEDLKDPSTLRNIFCNNPSLTVLNIFSHCIGLDKIYSVDALANFPNIRRLSFPNITLCKGENPKYDKCDENIRDFLSKIIDYSREDYEKLIAPILTQYINNNPISYLNEFYKTILEKIASGQNFNEFREQNNQILKFFKTNSFMVTMDCIQRAMSCHQNIVFLGHGSNNPKEGNFIEFFSGKTPVRLRSDFINQFNLSHCERISFLSCNVAKETTSDGNYGLMPLPLIAAVRGARVAFGFTENICESEIKTYFTDWVSKPLIGQNCCLNQSLDLYKAMRIYYADLDGPKAGENTPMCVSIVELSQAQNSFVKKYVYWKLDNDDKSSILIKYFSPKELGIEAGNSPPAKNSGYELMTLFDRLAGWEIQGKTETTSA